MLRAFALHRLFLCALVALAAPGCMVIDEIDNANAKMPKVEKKKKKSASPETGRTSVDEATARLVKQSERWWNQATSLSPEEAPSSIVQCRLSGGTQFMSRDDCLARGGSV